MSTQYEILTKPDLIVELDERSSKFELSMQMRPGTFQHEAENFPPLSTQVESHVKLTTADLVSMAFEILKVASYNGDVEELARAYLATKGPHAYERGIAEDLTRALGEPSED